MGDENRDTGANSVPPPTPIARLQGTDAALASRYKNAVPSLVQAMITAFAFGLLGTGVFKGAGGTVLTWLLLSLLFFVSHAGARQWAKWKWIEVAREAHQLRLDAEIEAEARVSAAEARAEDAEAALITDMHKQRAGMLKDGLIGVRWEAVHYAGGVLRAELDLWNPTGAEAQGRDLALDGLRINGADQRIQWEVIPQEPNSDGWWRLTAGRTRLVVSASVSIQAGRIVAATLRSLQFDIRTRVPGEVWSSVSSVRRYDVPPLVIEVPPEEPSTEPQQDA